MTALACRLSHVKHVICIFDLAHGRTIKSLSEKYRLEMNNRCDPYYVAISKFWDEFLLAVREKAAKSWIMIILCQCETRRTLFLHLPT